MMGLRWAVAFALIGRPPEEGIRLSGSGARSPGRSLGPPSKICSIGMNLPESVKYRLRYPPAMALGGKARTLAIGLVLASVLGVVLTPLGGLETRSIANTTTLGYVTVGLFLTGIVLNIVSIVLLFRKPRSASILASVGLILFFPVIVTDRTGLFSSQEAPPAIAYLEVITAIVLIAVLFLASRVYRDTASKGPGGA